MALFRDVHIGDRLQGHLYATLKKACPLIALGALTSGCFDENAPDELPPYNEEYSVDRGVYEPVITSNEGSGYGSGSGSGSGATSGSGAAAIPEGSGATPAPEEREYDSNQESFKGFEGAVGDEGDEDAVRDEGDEEAVRDEGDEEAVRDESEYFKFDRQMNERRR